ncbi:unnamed protein product, partial [Didymodactylos carnosus]
PLVDYLSPNSEEVHVDIEFQNNHLVINRNDLSLIIFRVGS